MPIRKFIANQSPGIIDPGCEGPARVRKRHTQPARQRSELKVKRSLISGHGQSLLSNKTNRCLLSLQSRRSSVTLER